MSVTPDDLHLAIGEKQRFTVGASDRFGNPISTAIVTWSVADSVGVIDDSGVFTSGTEAGSFVDAVGVDVVSGTVLKSASASITIEPSELAAIDVQPRNVTEIGTFNEHQFSATAFDQNGNEITDLEFAWSSTGGSVSSSGVYLSDFQQGRGTFEVRATASSGEVHATGSATVEIPAIHWDFALGLAGWTGNGNTRQLTSDTEGLSLTSDGFDPILISPAVLPISEPLRVILKMKSNATPGGEIMTQNSSRMFRIIPDNEWHEYTVQLPPQLPNSWLRIDPAEGAGEVSIAWVSVVPLNERTQLPNESSVPDIQYTYSTRFQHSIDPDRYGPMDLTIGPGGNIFVTERFGETVQVFDEDHVYLREIGGFVGSPNYEGSQAGIRVGPSGDLYVADSENSQIAVMSPNGVFRTPIGRRGSSAGAFDTPLDIAFDSNGNLYVVDSGNDRIQKFDPDHNFVGEWGSFGFRRGEFDGPEGIAIDSSDFVYVTDSNNHRIQKFTSTGVFVSEWGFRGASPGMLSRPTQIEIDGEDNIFVAEAFNDRVQLFTSSGAHVSSFGSQGSQPGQFRWPSGLHVTEDGLVYVADFRNGNVRVFRRK